MKEKYQELQATTGTLHIDQLVQKARERSLKVINDKLYQEKTEQFDEKLKSLAQEHQERVKADRNS